MALTTDGIQIQILSSIHTYRSNRDKCSTNDCKVVVSHLIRKYSEPLHRAGRVQRRASHVVMSGEIDDTIEDHAVPVIVLVEDLLGWDIDNLHSMEDGMRRLQAYLEQSLLLVEITRQEDALLSASGFQRRMPAGWSIEGDALYRNPLARYIACGISV